MSKSSIRHTHTDRVKHTHFKPCIFISKTSLLEEDGNLTSFAMMDSMACITRMMQWVLDMMNHTYVFGWKVTANTENREELSSKCILVLRLENGMTEQC